MSARSGVVDRAPPDTAKGGGGGGGWAWLMTASGIVEAQLVRGLLEVRGIVPVALDGRDPSPSAWMFLGGNVNAPVRVFVPASLLDDARLALLEEGFTVSAPSIEPAAEEPARRRAWRWVLPLFAIIVIAFVLWATLHGTATCMLGIAC